MSESNLRKCKDCGELKNRIQDGKFSSGRDKRWLDETGKQWNGSVCPNCQRNRVKLRVKMLRSKVSA
jgi:hypothetical protein